MKKTSKFILGVALTIFGAIGILAQPTLAVKCPDGSKNSTAESLTLCNAETSSKASSEGEVKGKVNNTIKLIIGVVGLLAVVFILVGGFQMATSAGNPAKVAKAKNTILYAVIGLVVALLSYAIVDFVLDKIFGIS